MKGYNCSFNSDAHNSETNSISNFRHTNNISQMTTDIGYDQNEIAATSTEDLIILQKAILNYLRSPSLKKRNPKFLILLTRINSEVFKRKYKIIQSESLFVSPCSETNLPGNNTNVNPINNFINLNSINKKSLTSSETIYNESDRGSDTILSNDEDSYKNPKSEKENKKYRNFTNDIAHTNKHLVKAENKYLAKTNFMNFDGVKVYNHSILKVQNIISHSLDMVQNDSKKFHLKNIFDKNNKFKTNEKKEEDSFNESLSNKSFNSLESSTIVYSMNFTYESNHPDKFIQSLKNPFENKANDHKYCNYTNKQDSLYNKKQDNFKLYESLLQLKKNFVKDENLLTKKRSNDNSSKEIHFPNFLQDKFCSLSSQAINTDNFTLVKDKIPIIEENKSYKSSNTLKDNSIASKYIFYSNFNFFYLVFMKFSKSIYVLYKILMDKRKFHNFLF